MKTLWMSLLVTCFSSAVFALSLAPISSKEDVRFIHKNDQKLLGLTQTSDFDGVIVRVQETDKDLEKASLYSLKNITNLHMDQELCKQALAKIFGPLKEISLKVQSVEVWTSHTGKTCEAVVVDPDKESKIPERRVEIGLINAKAMAVVFNLSKKASPAAKENIRGFWESLR